MPKAKSVIEKTNKREKEDKDIPITPDVDETTPEEVNEDRKEDDNEPIDVVIVKDNDAPITGAIFVRQYSQEVHGDDYKALAEEFCTKKPKGFGQNNCIYKALPSSIVGDVEVRYREKKDYDLHIDKQDPNAPVIDKVQRFSKDEKPEAVRFGSQKYDSTVVVSRPRPNRE